MKTIIAALFMSFNAHAITYEVIGPCSPTPAYSGTYDLENLSINAGKASINIFNRDKIPYIGVEKGINTILNTPIGPETLEIISGTKMRAYGWCYTVNGVGPDIMPDEYFFQSNNDKLVWFYAYSTYDNGNWTDYCMPSYKIKAARFCDKK